MPCAKSMDKLELTRDCGFIGKQGLRPATASDKVRQSFQCGASPTKPRHELPVADRTDIGRSYQSKLVKLFLVSPHFCYQLLLLPMRGSVPSIKFSIFVRCFQNMISVHAVSMATRS